MQKIRSKKIREVGQNFVQKSTFTLAWTFVSHWDSRNERAYTVAFTPTGWRKKHFFTPHASLFKGNLAGVFKKKFFFFLPFFFSSLFSSLFSSWGQRKLGKNRDQNQKSLIRANVNGKNRSAKSAKNAQTQFYFSIFCTIIFTFKVYL